MSTQPTGADEKPILRPTSNRRRKISSISIRPALQWKPVSSKSCGQNPFSPCAGWESWLSRFPGSDQNPSDQLAFIGGGGPGAGLTPGTHRNSERVAGPSTEEGRFQVS